jgi:hypothetical protein
MELGGSSSECLIGWELDGWESTWISWLWLLLGMLVTKETILILQQVLVVDNTSSVEGDVYNR